MSLLGEQASAVLKAFNAKIKLASLVGNKFFSNIFRQDFTNF